MSATNILESTTQLIKSQIKNNIAAALAAVRANRDDAAVSTEVPAEYFIYDQAIGYKTPAIFVIADYIDFRLDRGQNHINAAVSMIISCVVEDKSQENLTIKAYRYFDALHDVLERSQLVNKSESLKLVITVRRAEISRTAQIKTSVESKFRKEIMMTLNVEHYQQE